MAGILFVLLLAIPIAELWVIIQVADFLGLAATLGLLILVSVAGTYLLKQQGLITWARLQQSLAEGRMPTQEVTDGALILLGGALLLTPGFITDAAGLVLLLPPSRALIKGAFRKLLRGWAARRFVPPGGRTVYDATVIRSRARTTRDDPPAAPERELRSRGDDSRDRG